MFDVEAFHRDHKWLTPEEYRRAWNGKTDHTPNILGANCWNADGTYNHAKADKVCRERVKRAPPGFTKYLTHAAPTDSVEEYGIQVAIKRGVLPEEDAGDAYAEVKDGQLIVARRGSQAELCVIDLHHGYAPAVKADHLPRGWIWGEDGVKIPAPECAAKAARKPAGKRGRPRKAPAPTRAPEREPAGSPDALARDPLDDVEADLRALMAQWLDAGEPAPRAPAPRAPDPAPVELAPWSPALCEYVLAASLARVLGAG